LARIRHFWLKLAKNGFGENPPLLAETHQNTEFGQKSPLLAETCYTGLLVALSDHPQQLALLAKGGEQAAKEHRLGNCGTNLL
jgi:hypothetical protein